MAEFEYQAITRSGEAVRGHIVADNLDAARDLLTGRGIFPRRLEVCAVTVSEGIQARSATEISRLRLSMRERVEFITRLADALEAQLGLLEALSVVQGEKPRPHMRFLVGELIARLKSGESFSEALSHYPRSFSRLHVAIVAGGEATGRLDYMMRQLARLIEQQQQMRSQITTAGLYPCFVLCLGIISVVIIVTWILPQVLATLTSNSSLWPAPTRILIWLSIYLRRWGVLIGAVLVGAVVVWKLWKRTTVGRYVIDSLKLRLPFYGKVQRRWALARFARTWSVLLEGGVGMIEALGVVGGTLGNAALARDIAAMREQVRRGVSPAQAMNEYRWLGGLLGRTVRVGQETGRLAELLKRTADSLDRQTDIAVKRFMTLFPAVLIVLLAGVVGFIVAATLLPIVEMETAMPGL
ncbi:MAG: type II secretion system F family protein [Sedimentisphaerales bacterium]|nr:type II secretion system F family protein [Sedimentisphaerales bacterium]